MERESGRSTGNEVAFVLGTFAGLGLLLDLPDLLLHGFGPSGALAHPSASALLGALFSWDVFVLFSLYGLLPASWSVEGPLDRVSAGLLVGLILYAIYEAAVSAMLHRPPNFYADRSHLVGALYLVVNGAVPALHLVGLGAGLGIAGLAGWQLPPLMRRIHGMLGSSRARQIVFAVNGIVWAGLLASAVLGAPDPGPEVNPDPEIAGTGSVRAEARSRTIGLVQNVRRSIALRRRITGRWDEPADSSYVDYLERPLARRVPIYLVVLESYGSTLAASPETRSRYTRFMARTVDSLNADGWHVVTGRSEAPVFGGLSWLSVSSILTGTPIAHQPVLDALRPRLPRYPHLPRILEEAGYGTATVQAPVRRRPGLTVSNPYGFDRTFYHQELAYTGPAFAWGIVPDQYSLAVAHRQFVEGSEEPFFLLFETVSSHAPWQEPPPPIVEAPTDAAAYRNDPDPDRDFGFEGRAPVASRHLAHIRYQWRILERYIREHAPRESLFLVVGDHQPHFARHGGASTPVHLISRNGALLHRLKAYDFQTGGLPPQFPTSLTHAGLYSVLMQALLAPRSTPDPVEHRPGVHLRGVRHSALLPTRR